MYIHVCTCTLTALATRIVGLVCQTVESLVWQDIRGSGVDRVHTLSATTLMKGHREGHANCTSMLTNTNGVSMHPGYYIAVKHK